MLWFRDFRISFFPNSLVGDNSGPLPTGMELWDTTTNNTIEVAHPPGFEGNEGGNVTRFFRPVISTFGEDSIILTGSKIVTGVEDESFMNEMFKYEFGTGTWSSLGQSKIDAKNQYGIYVVDGTKKNTFDILNQCSA